MRNTENIGREMFKLVLSFEIALTVMYYSKDQSNRFQDKNKIKRKIGSRYPHICFPPTGNIFNIRQITIFLFCVKDDIQRNLKKYLQQ